MHFLTATINTCLSKDMGAGCAVSFSLDYTVLLNRDVK